MAPASISGKESMLKLLIVRGIEQNDVGKSYFVCALSEPVVAVVSGLIFAWIPILQNSISNSNPRRMRICGSKVHRNQIPSGQKLHNVPGHGDATVRQAAPTNRYHLGPLTTCIHSATLPDLAWPSPLCSMTITSKLSSRSPLEK